MFSKAIAVAKLAAIGPLNEPADHFSHVLLTPVVVLVQEVDICFALLLRTSRTRTESTLIVPHQVNDVLDRVLKAKVCSPVVQGVHRFVHLLEGSQWLSNDSAIE